MLGMVCKLDCVCLLVTYIHSFTHKYIQTYYVGTKNVAKMLKKVCVGTVAQRGKTWFPEFTDKSMLHNKLL